MKTERELVNQLGKDIEAQNYKTITFRILRDTFGGPKKPYDVTVCVHSLHFSLEFKRFDGRLEDHQEKALKEDFLAGGFSFVPRFSKDEKSIAFHLVTGDGMEEQPVFTWYKPGKSWFSGSATASKLFGSLIIVAERAREAE